MKRRARRDEERRFLIEGPAAIGDVLASGTPVIELFVRAPADDHADLVDRANAAGANVHVVGERVLNAIADARTPQGVVAVAEMRSAHLDDLATADLVVVLAELRDPGNAGTLVRSAAAAAVDGAVFTAGGVDPFHPKTVRAAAGALFQTRIVRGEGLDDALDALRHAGLRLLGADARAATTMYDADLSGRVALVLGNETRGLPPDLRDSLDATVAIPMPGHAESLNVAIAGSVLLFEALRQRRAR